MLAIRNSLEINSEIEIADALTPGDESSPYEVIVEDFPIGSRSAESRSDKERILNLTPVFRVSVEVERRY